MWLCGGPEAPSTERLAKARRLPKVVKYCKQPKTGAPPDIAGYKPGDKQLQIPRESSPTCLVTHTSVSTGCGTKAK